MSRIEKAVVQEPKFDKTPDGRAIDGIEMEPPRGCPICNKPMASVMRSVACPCDAPWCSVTESRLACAECGQAVPVR